MIESLLVDVADDLMVIRDALGQMAPAANEGEAIDRIRFLEEIKAACAAGQARETVAFEELRLENEADRGVPKTRQGRGAAAEVALARRESPARGSRYLGLAKALAHEMPLTMAKLTSGVVSEEKAVAVCRETAWLTAEDRRKVDEHLDDRLEQAGVRRLAAEARAHAQRLDQEAAVRQLERAAQERRVSVRPASPGMVYLSALVPMSQGVAAYANLHDSATSLVGTGEAGGRSHRQVMADLLLTRLTGHDEPGDIPVELQVVMRADSLIGGDRTPAWLTGHGPIPAHTARRLVSDSEAQVFVRRLYTAPESGQLVGMDSRRREFSGLLRQMVIFRDDTCRTPWCDAAIKHVDHATPLPRWWRYQLGERLRAVCPVQLHERELRLDASGEPEPTRRHHPDRPQLFDEHTTARHRGDARKRSADG